MKHQALFHLKDKSEKIKCCLLQCLFGALRVNVVQVCSRYCYMFSFVIGLFKKFPRILLHTR